MTFLPGSVRGTTAVLFARLSKARQASALFAIMAAVFLAWPIWRLGLPIEVNRNEAWNAWFTSAVLEGKPLYPKSGALIVNNYPPLSFYITALTAKLTGDAIIAGRAIALISAGLVSWAAGLCVRALGGSRSASVLAGFWLLATLARFYPRYVGVNDPSLLGLALMGLALADFLLRLRDERSVAPAIALMVVAGFVKHNAPALPLTAILWLATMRGGRAALQTALSGALLVCAGLALCVFVFGPDFLMQMSAPREITLKHMFSTINKLQWIAPALLFWGFWAWPNREKPEAKFSALLIALSLASGIFQAAGAGMTYNAYFEVVFASAVAVAIAFEGFAKSAVSYRLSTETIQVSMIALLALRLVLAQQLEPFLVLSSPSFRDSIRERSAVFEAETARVAALPDAFSCSIMTVCYRAGKPFVYDGFWVEQLIAKGRMTREAAIAAFSEKGIKAIVVDPKASVEKMRLF